MRDRRRQHRFLHGAGALACTIGALLPGALLDPGLAQVPDTTSNTPYTFHIYEDLVQIPALVFDRGGRSYGDLRLADFTIRLDSGPAFHPLHYRLQGADPMHLAIFLDGSSGDRGALAARWQKTLAALPEAWLSPDDTVAVYAADCNLVQTTVYRPYSRDTLLHGVELALAAHDLHQPRTAGAPCSTNGRLWDELATITTSLAQEPGWRVILALTDGVDGNSNATWKELGRYAGLFSVSIFGFRSQTRSSSAALPKLPDSRARRTAKNEDAFALLCAGTGGLALPVPPETLGAQLLHAISLLHNRYILEFARPSNGTAGFHDISVIVPDRLAIVNLSGVSFPPPDKELLGAPNALQSDPSRAPLTGDRRILTQPH